MDEPLVDIITPYIKWRNEKYQTNFKKTDLKVYKVWKIWGGDLEKEIEDFEEFYKTDLFRKIQPTRGAQSALLYLSGEHEIEVITGRPKIIEKETYEQIEEHYKEIFRSINIAGVFGKAKGVKKKDLCKERGIEIMIEDNLEEAIELLENKIPIYLFNAPWNQLEPNGLKELPKGIKRVYNWIEIVQEIS